MTPGSFINMDARNTMQESVQEKLAIQLSCQFCDYKTTCGYFLSLHKRVHTRKKLRECYFCDKNFKRNSNLEVHERTHTRERHYQCYLCNFATSRKQHLEIHQRQHYSDDKQPKKKPKPKHECRFCNYQCSNVLQLIKHVRNHAIEDPFECKYCPFACDQISALRFHEEKEHGVFHGQSQRKFPRKFPGKFSEEKDLTKCYKNNNLEQFQEKGVSDEILEPESHIQVQKKEDNRKFHASSKLEKICMEDMAFFAIQHRMSDFMFHQQTAVKKQQKS